MRFLSLRRSPPPLSRSESCLRVGASAVGQTDACKSSGGNASGGVTPPMTARMSGGFTSSRRLFRTPGRRFQNAGNTYIVQPNPAPDARPGNEQIECVGVAFRQLRQLSGGKRQRLPVVEIAITPLG